MNIPFTLFFERLKRATGISTQMDLAKALELNRSAITQAKLRDAVPAKWILMLARKYTISADWLEFGTGAPRAAEFTSSGENDKVAHTPRAKAAQQAAEKSKALASEQEIELVNVPKVMARLCAGGGSFEINANPMAKYTFPHAWLAKMGTPSSMVFMDVVGDSMEPGILDGDMVLVDQSNININAHGVFAVGVDDALFLKRVQRRNGGLALVSDNQLYSPMELYQDELDSFRVLGKVVWLCRDCRFY